MFSNRAHPTEILMVIWLGITEVKLKQNAQQNSDSICLANFIKSGSE